MKFCVLLSCSWTVKFADRINSGWIFDMTKGACWLRVKQIEDMIQAAISTKSFGSSIERYVFGFEISDTSEGFTFEGTRGYVSYRPQTRTLVSVGQADWPEIRFLSATEQLDIFNQLLLDSIDRAASARRKPRDFDFKAFRLAMSKELETLEHQDCITLLD